MIQGHHFHPTEKKLLCGGSCKLVLVFDYGIHKWTKEQKGHTDTEGLFLTFWLDQGKKVLTSDSQETILWDTRTDDWQMIFHLNDMTFLPLYTDHRNLGGVYYNKQIHLWSKKIILEFAEDYEEEEDENVEEI